MNHIRRYLIFSISTLLALTFNLNAQDRVVCPLNTFEHTPCFYNSCAHNSNLPETLPIELSLFEDEVIEAGNEILWVTQTETDYDYFVLERSDDGSSFERIYSVQGSLYSTTETKYHFLDESPVSEVQYYRLKSVDIFGITEYSDILSLSRDPLEPTILIDIIPNPTVDYLELNWNHSAFSYVLFDTTGKPVLKGRTSSQTTLDLRTLPAGIYYLSLVKGSEKMNRQIIKN